MKNTPITLDQDAGFCFGVDKAIQKAEEEVAAQKKLYCLGQIVHNDKEVERLEKKGVRFINHDEYKLLRNERVLIRAHGEPPETFLTAEKNKLTLIDATCPIVTKLQDKVRSAWDQIKAYNGQVVIYGNRNHPEILGLSGQIGYHALIIENKEEINLIDFTRPVYLFSQTTKSRERYEEIIQSIKKRFTSAALPDDFFQYRTSVCGQVANRAPHLRIFAKAHDVIIFVSGEKSSNGKYLYEVCREINPQSHKVSKTEQLKPEWFVHAASVGVSGATSTPSWLLEEIVDKIRCYVS